MRGYEPYTYQPLLRWFYEGQHYGAVAQFTDWLKREAPEAHAKITEKRPDLLEVRSVLMGISPRASGGGLSGMGETPLDDGQGPVSTWGTQILDLAKGWMTYDMQRDLFKLNIARAEQGLPPISGSTLAPQVNVGVSPQLQSIGTFAVVGLVAVGLIAAFRRR